MIICVNYVTIFHWTWNVLQLHFNFNMGCIDTEASLEWEWNLQERQDHHHCKPPCDLCKSETILSGVWLSPDLIFWPILYLGPDWGPAQTLKIWLNRIPRFHQIRPKGFILGWTQTLTHPMWRPRWHNFGIRPQAGLKKSRRAFPRPKLSTWVGLGSSVG